MVTVPRLDLRRLRPRRADERGAVAIMIALSMTFLVVTTALVLDFGLVRLDRQQLRNISDSAAMAGIAAGDGATGDVYSHRAVCGALASLRATRQFAPQGSFTGLPDSTCATAALASNVNVKCKPGITSTYSTYDQTVTRGEVTYRVRIEAPYDPTSGDWAEEDLAAVTADQSTLGGCDQLGVQIWESRDPGLGSLATSSDLAFGVRSAARALIGTEDDMAPSFILLERTACPAVSVGAAGAGAGTHIVVRGYNATPGSIHSDSDATGAGCGSGSNQQLFQGKQNDGIVAYGSNTPAGTSGAITSYATLEGRGPTTVYDSSDFVYGTKTVCLPTALTCGAGTTKIPVTGRGLVTRSPVDSRYREALRTAINNERTVWNGTSGWTVATCTPTPQELQAVRLYINCPNSSGITLTATIESSEVFLNGFVKGGYLSMPNALKVYVNNTNSSGSRISDSAIGLTNTTAFCVRTTCTATNSTACPTTPASARAKIFVRRGRISASGGTLRMCNSTVLMLNGDTDWGCVPTTDGTAPTAAPCPSSSTPTGTGTIDVSGTTVFDWTAPNEFMDSVPLASRATAFANFEDLGMWSEAAGTFSFAGSGGLNTRGIFMVPNAALSVGGGSSQTLVDAQYIARTFAVSGGGTLSLTTDPRNAVTIPAIKGYVLVR